MRYPHEIKNLSAFGARLNISFHHGTLCIAKGNLDRESGEYDDLPQSMSTSQREALGAFLKKTAIVLGKHGISCKAFTPGASDSWRVRVNGWLARDPVVMKFRRVDRMQEAYGILQDLLTQREYTAVGKEGHHFECETTKDYTGNLPCFSLRINTRPNTPEHFVSRPRAPAEESPEEKKEENVAQTLCKEFRHILETKYKVDGYKINYVPVTSQVDLTCATYAEAEATQEKFAAALAELQQRYKDSEVCEHAEPEYWRKSRRPVSPGEPIKLASKDRLFTLLDGYTIEGDGAKGIKDLFAALQDATHLQAIHDAVDQYNVTRDNQDKKEELKQKLSSLYVKAPAQDAPRPER